MKANNFN